MPAIATPPAMSLSQALLILHGSPAARRRSASNAGRERKQIKHKELIEKVEGDREKLKIIHIWQPRNVKTKLLAKGYQKTFVQIEGTTHCYSHDPESIEAEYDDTEYDLVEVEIERAKHPKEEVEFAKLQGRFLEQQRSIFGLFAAPTACRYAARPNDWYAPLDPMSKDDLDNLNRVPRAERIKQRAICAKRLMPSIGLNLKTRKQKIK